MWAGLLLALCLPLGAARALEPTEVVVLANRRSPAGCALAREYLVLRGIPEANYLEVAASLDESCSQADYREDVARPVKAFMAAHAGPESIRAITVFHGIPLSNLTRRSDR